MRVNITNPLIGLTVMVEPYLTTDPTGKRGQTGQVIFADDAEGRIIVRFDDNKVGSYTYDALITTFPAESIQHLLHATISHLNHFEFGNIEEIFKLVAREECAKALQSVLGYNLVIKRASTLDCRALTDMQRELKELKQEKSRDKRMQKKR